jgi:hypothetical protein
MSKPAGHSSRERAVRRLRPALVIAAILSVVLAHFARTEAGATPHGGPGLEVRDLRVSPPVLWSGDSVRVDAVLVNNADVVVWGLSIGVAVDESGPSSRRWKPLQKSHPAPIESIAPGEVVNFSGHVQLEGSGWFRVGIAGLAANSIVAPQGRRVWVVDSRVQAIELGLSFALFTALIAAVLSILRVFAWSSGRPAIWAPHPPLLVLGLALMVFGPWLVWSARYSLGRGRGVDAALPWALAFLPVTGVLFFAVGWLLTGAGLRPQHSLRRGTLLAGGLYILVGVTWLIGFNLSVGEPAARVAQNLVTQPLTALALAMIWPLQVAQVFGWFGLSLG